MIQTLKSLHEKLRTSIWPIPAAVVLACLALSQVAIQLDKLPSMQRFSAKFLSISQSSAETIMTTIAGSVITVGGVVLSMTMVAMTLASGQFGPKVLREYLGNRSSKITLGLFIGTFLYCIVALVSYKAISGPGLYILIGVGLALLSFFMFVHFIHNTTTSIQVDRVVYQIAAQLQDHLIDLAEQTEEAGRDQGSALWRKGARGKAKHEISVEETGYVESVSYTSLVELAKANDSYIEVLIRAGQFVIPGQTICHVYDDTEEIDDQTIRNKIIIGVMRTPVQDPEFPITQLIQIAARALSPGINDPGTAITCVDWLSTALARVIDRDLPNYCFTDEDGTVRVIGDGISFQGLFSAIFIPLRQHSRGNLSVILRILESLQKLACLTNRKDRLECINKLTKEIETTALVDASCETDKADINSRMASLSATINQSVTSAKHSDVELDSIEHHGQTF